MADCDRAIALAPDDANGWLSRASVLLQVKQIARAYSDCATALALASDSAQAHLVQGLCLAGLGRVDEALASFDRALDIQPDLQSAISSKIFTLDFAADATVEQHQQARQVWWERVGAKIASEAAGPYDNSCDPDRRLVLGYVSSDFNAHSAAFIFKPVLQHHDRARFEIVCYSCSSRVDATTREFEGMADRWRDAAQWTDDRLAAQIRADGVDILIDLSGHTRGNRLGVFARKPAPIQVHGWGHGTGTGLPTIEYLFSDPVAIPVAVRHLFVETVIDLPCFVTLAPLPAGIARAGAPALSNGFVTFGVFTRISKISDEAVDVWSRILERVPGSRLLIKDFALDDRLVRDNLLARFAACRLPAERVELLGATSRDEHLASFNRIDICLDTFPQNGGVSTWEALQMGVPVVAKLGNSLPGRAAGSILTALGLPTGSPIAIRHMPTSRQSAHLGSATFRSCAANCRNGSEMLPPATPSPTRARWTTPTARCGNGTAAIAPDLCSMQPEYAVHRAQLGGLDQLGMRHRDRVERAVELLLPECQEILQRRKFRKHVVVLPDIGLEQRRMIRHPIENLCRRQSVSQHLLPEIVGNTPNAQSHAKPPLQERIQGVA